MDPLSVTTGCLSLLGSVVSTTTAVTSFIRSCREARGDLTAVTRELSDLKIVLELLRDETDIKDNRVIPEKLRAQIVSILGSCEDVLKKINELLQRHSANLGALRWVIDGKREVAGLKQSLEAYRGALSVVLDTVNLALTIEIKADTSAIRVDAAEIKQDTEQILAEIARLRALIPAGEETTADAQNFVLQRYLDNLTSYAETVCEETLESASVDSKSTGTPQELDDLRHAITIIERNLDIRATTDGLLEQNLLPDHVPQEADVSPDWGELSDPVNPETMDLPIRDRDPAPKLIIQAQNDLLQTPPSAQFDPPDSDRRDTMDDPLPQGCMPLPGTEITVREHEDGIQLGIPLKKLWSTDRREDQMWSHVRQAFSADGGIFASGYVDYSVLGARTDSVRIRRTQDGIVLADLKFRSRKYRITDPLSRSSYIEVQWLAISPSTDKHVVIETVEYSKDMPTVWQLGVWDWEIGKLTHTFLKARMGAEFPGIEFPGAEFPRVCWQAYPTTDRDSWREYTPFVTGKWSFTHIRHASFDPAYPLPVSRLLWTGKFPDGLSLDSRYSHSNQFRSGPDIGHVGVFSKSGSTTLVIVVPEIRYKTRTVLDGSLFWTWVTIPVSEVMNFSTYPSRRYKCAADGRFLCLLHGLSAYKSYIHSPTHLLVWDSRSHLINLFHFPESLYGKAILSPDASLVVCIQEQSLGRFVGVMVYSIDIFDAKTGYWLACIPINRSSMGRPSVFRGGEVVHISFRNWGFELIVTTGSSVQCFSLDSLARADLSEREPSALDLSRSARNGANWEEIYPKKTEISPFAHIRMR